MKAEQRGALGSAQLKRNRRAGGAGLAAVLLAGGLVSGCNDDEALRAFRDAAANGLQSGASAIADGLIDGAFAVFTLGADEQTDGGGEETTDGG